jgi:hypothetical protein
MPAAKSPVDVEIESEPSGAVVYRAGKRLGATPLALRVKPDEQMVLVELRLAGYRPLAAELTASDGTRKLALTPTRAQARRPRKGAASSNQAKSSPAAKASQVAKRSDAEDTEPRAPAATEPRSEGPAKPPGPYERFE